LGFQAFGRGDDVLEVADPLVHHSVSDLSAFSVAFKTLIDHLVYEHIPSRNVDWQFVFMHNFPFPLSNGRLNEIHLIVEVLVHEFGVKLMDDFSNVKLVLFF